MDIFEKCYQYKMVKEYKAMGLYPFFRAIDSAQDTEVLIQDKQVLMLGSNSYLGLTTDPRVKQASIDAIKYYGSGNAGSRFLNGTLKIHEDLERDLAKFMGKESALLFPTGWMTNVGVVSALISPDDIVFSDKTNHASIVDAIRLSPAKKVIRYKHNDMEDLERLLKKFQQEPGGRLIISDGVFSMEGDIVNLPRLTQLAKEYRCRTFIDDAHSVGVLGEDGAGTASHFNLVSDVDLIMYTFSKSFASIGGVIAGEEAVISYLKHHSRALIFSASPSAGTVASVAEALRIIQSEPERRKRLWDITHFMNHSFKDMGFDTGVSETPIIPIIIKDFETVLTFWKKLTEENIFVNPVIPPAVPSNSCLIRTSFMATHTDEQLERALKVFKKVGQELKVI